MEWEEKMSAVEGRQTGDTRGLNLTPHPSTFSASLRRARSWE